MIDGVEDALRALLHDNPAGLAAAVALIAALIMLVLRAAAPSKPKTFLDPQQVRRSGRGASRLRVQKGNGSRRLGAAVGQKETTIVSA